MSIKTRTRGALAGAAGVALLAGGLLAGGPALAAPESENANPAADCAGRSIPASKVSFQMFSQLGWQFAEGDVEPVLAALSEAGYKNIEGFGNPGSFFSTYGDRTADEFRALLKEYGLKMPSAHGNTNEATFDETLEWAKAVGQKYTGSGGFPAPGINSGYENVLLTAEAMNRLGERSVKAGVGKFFGHNHQSEFTTTYTVPETGEVKSAWEILVENTDPRWVTFQVDVFWASDAGEGVDVPALLEKYGDRIELLHIKDGDLNGEGRGVPGNVGQGDIHWEPILEEALGHVNLYVIERDGAPNDATFLTESFDYLTCLEY
ncbi:sugar phosphate isomerase/epimerase family protein [Agromyces mangrovi Wang et al. 2018]|uniref:sugar phosphate isomerase/epimerase family protein n=1 Tax=Agromyces mangrovi TaxID=1858653 RepID=UPI0025739C32|nr:sugar phosphate isomerase/epimerase [Agromyces mangrovi]BDZ65218.1 hypothetical protein GCM10025877_21560 [Agromyces mangrovi]